MQMQSRIRSMLFNILNLKLANELTDCGSIRDVVQLNNIKKPWLEAY